MEKTSHNEHENVLERAREVLEKAKEACAKHEALLNRIAQGRAILRKRTTITKSRSAEGADQAKGAA